MERPNTIAGLQAKRAELAKLHANLISEARKVVCDIDHIDATIRLFDPDADLERIRLNRYATKHRAHKGYLKRFVLNTLRTAEGPITSRFITEAWIKDRGLQPDEATFIILRKRIGACLTTLQRGGAVSGSDDGGEYKSWRLSRSEK